MMWCKILAFAWVKLKLLIWNYPDKSGSSQSCSASPTHVLSVHLTLFFSVSYVLRNDHVWQSVSIPGMWWFPVTSCGPRKKVCTYKNIFCIPIQCKLEQGCSAAEVYTWLDRTIHVTLFPRGFFSADWIWVEQPVTATVFPAATLVSLYILLLRKGCPSMGCYHQHNSVCVCPFLVYAWVVAGDNWGCL